MNPLVHFRATGARIWPAAARPALALGLEVTAAGGEPVDSVLVRIQVRIAARERGYSRAAEARLADVFGEPERWGQTVGDLWWSQETLVIPAFTGRTTVDLPLYCSYDFEAASAKYLAALDEGDIPVRLLFSGSVFRRGGQGLVIHPIAWEEEALARVPVGLWREAMEAFFPGQAWLRLERATFDRLNAWRSRHGFASWEEAVRALLARDEEEGGRRGV